MGAEAQAVLARVRARQARAPAEGSAREVLVRLHARRANDVSDLWTFYSTSDIRGMLDQLKASYEVVNVAAKGRPDWDIHYREFLSYYKELADKTESWWRSFGLSQGTIDGIRDRRAQLEQWKAKLRADGVKVGDPDRKEPDDSLGGVKDLLGLGALVLFLLWAVK